MTDIQFHPVAQADKRVQDEPCTEYMVTRAGQPIAHCWRPRGLERWRCVADRDAMAGPFGAGDTRAEAVAEYLRDVAIHAWQANPDTLPCPYCETQHGRHEPCTLCHLCHEPCRTPEAGDVLCDDCLTASIPEDVRTMAPLPRSITTLAPTGPAAPPARLAG